MSQISITVNQSVALPIGPEGSFDFTESNHDNTWLQFYAPLKGHGSIANVSRELAKYLIRNYSDVLVCNYSGTSNQQTQDFLQRQTIGLQKNASIGFFYGFPDFVPEFFFDHGYKIGGFVCEASEIPEHWAKICNRFDLIVLPSQFCKEVFEGCGVTVPIKVIAHGIEPEFKPVKEVLPSQKEFWFFNIFADRFHERKGARELIRSFMREFNNEPNVKLLLHVDRPIEVEKLIYQFEATGRVLTSGNTQLTTQELALLYQKMHVTVHPTRGEGFGLIPLQSLACGTPVISAIHTGMKDYLTPEYILETEVACVRPSFHQFGHMKDAGFISDEEHLRACMRQAYSHWQEEKEKALRASETLRPIYQWDKVLLGLDEMLSTHQ